MASAQLKQMRKTVALLKSRLEKEAKSAMSASKVVAEAKKARGTLMSQVKSLRDEGSRVAKELKRALGDADKREAARRQAVQKIAELRAELAHRTEELKRKSEELGKLAMESAGRAKDIIMSEEPAASASASRTTETESVSAETVRREESPRESSIERELHPERKG
jgi:seryl-tRNA synthetase